jgi:hypothetical protein
MNVTTQKQPIYKYVTLDKILDGPICAYHFNPELLGEHQCMQHPPLITTVDIICDEANLFIQINQTTPFDSETCSIQVINNASVHISINKTAYPGRCFVCKLHMTINYVAYLIYAALY